jgi:hypothetical protein
MGYNVIHTNYSKVYSNGFPMTVFCHRPPPPPRLSSRLKGTPPAPSSDGRVILCVHQFDPDAGGFLEPLLFRRKPGAVSKNRRPPAIASRKGPLAVAAAAAAATAAARDADAQSDVLAELCCWALRLAVGRTIEMPQRHNLPGC